MNFDKQALKNAIIVFLRACFSAGMAAAVVYTQHFNLLSGSAQDFGRGVTIAFVTGVLLFAGDWLRSLTTQPVTSVTTRRQGAGRHFLRTKSWADFLPF